MLRALSVAALVLVLAATPACTSSQSDARVGFEAQWQCDVQRRTFDDIADIEQARSDALERWGLSDDEYRSFRAELGRSESLRAAVAVAYDEYCGE